MKTLSDYWGDLSPAKRELLKLLLDEEERRSTDLHGPDGLLPEAIPIRKPHDRIPLSFAQHRLWFLHQLTPNSPAHNQPVFVGLHGTLNFPALKRSLCEIVRRHEILRTTFQDGEAGPVQVVAPFMRPNLPQIDLSRVAALRQEGEVARLAENLVGEPFHLDEGPLIRSCVLRLTDEDYVLASVMQHLVSDGWSVGVLNRELAILYEAFLTGHSSPLQELPIQYADFAVWQRRVLDAERLKPLLAYWKGQLTNISPLELATDFRRPPVQSYRGSQETTFIGPDLLQALDRLSQQEHVTLFMLMLATFQTLLFRYSESTDIVVGCPVANRLHPQTESLIGCFANTLVLRSDLSGHPTFRELLARVRRVCLEAYAHQGLPFEKLVEDLNPDRDLSHNALFQVLFSFLTTPRPSTPVPGLTMSLLELGSSTARLDLAMEVYADRGGLVCCLEYNTSLFEKGSITSMLSCFKTLLQAIIVSTDRSISTLPILSSAEEQQLSAALCPAMPHSMQPRCLHELFEAQVDRTPDAVALAFEGQQLTYAELNRQANGVASLLQANGVGPEVVVGLCVERSLDLIVGVLGILKAGGAYLPLDLEHPKLRLALLMEDAHVSILLSQERLRGALPPTSAKLIWLDQCRQHGAVGREIGNSANQTVPSNLAYVMYTSGSTGKPKAVGITHENVTSWFEGTRAIVHCDANDVWSLFHSYTFDFSVWEIWGALLHGGRLVIVPTWVTRAPDVFYEFLREERVSVLSQTPLALLQLLATRQGASLFDDLSIRVVCCSGEALPRDLAVAVSEANVALWNFYGPTEGTVWVTAHRVHSDALPRPTVPIGAPLPNREVHILDAHLNRVPVNVPGELYIGGQGVTRGYLGAPELTAERLVPDPYSHVAGARLYRTGDIVRYSRSGQIEFLGRRDGQVKIRGFRVEVGEVASVLTRHSDVSDSFIVTKRSERGQHLVAYVVSRVTGGAPVKELRRFLKQYLPEYMIPSAFVFVDRFPMTVNGKIDTSALPNPFEAGLHGDVPSATSSHPTEEVLRSLWAEVLNLEDVRTDDNFFDLGGHSLLAAQVVARIRAAFHLDVSLRTFFEMPTVAEMAEWIDTARSTRG
jgi:amino acid adenylation domain-containing protein